MPGDREMASFGRTTIFDRPNPSFTWCVDHEESFTSASPALSVHWAKIQGKDLFVLPDTGAVDNRCGIEWAVHAANLCREKGVAMRWTRHDPQKSSGIGTATCRGNIDLPICIGERAFTFMPE